MEHTDIGGRGVDGESSVGGIDGNGSIGGVSVDGVGVGV
jgi:hypothetical protein